jgi:hypothetical protein
LPPDQERACETSQSALVKTEFLGSPFAQPTWREWGGKYNASDVPDAI